MVIIAWLAVIFTTTWLGRYEEQRLAKKAERLVVGMTEGELLKIMGRPLGKDEAVDPEILTDAQVNPTNVVELTFGVSFPYSPERPIGGIYLDDVSKKIVFIQLYRWLVEVDNRTEAIRGIISIVVMALLIRLVFKLWCIQVLRKANT